LCVIIIQEKVDQLRVKCDAMLSREQSYEAAGKKDCDIQQQMSLEVESLRVVIEQKNEEIHKLRQSLTEHEMKVKTDLSCVPMTINFSYLCQF